MKKYIQDTNTLRLLIMYSQFADVDDVVFAFNVLQDKDYEKSLYITKAINYFDKTQNDTFELTEAFFPLRCMNFIRKYYGINTKKSIQELLALGPESETYLNACDRMLKAEAPRPGLLGFNKNTPEAVAMHDRLFQMEVRERIMLISTAIKKYVMDGMDSAALMACSYKLVHDTMDEYEQSDDKTAVVQHFYDLLKRSKDLQEAHDEEE